MSGDTDFQESEHKQECKRNTDGMKASAAKKAAVAREKVTTAIDRLLREGQAVNFNSVVAAAGVARSYLYAQKDIKARIEGLRGKPPTLRLVSGPVKEVERTEKSKDTLLAAKDIKIKELETENRQLKAEIKSLHGKLYDARK